MMRADMIFYPPSIRGMSEGQGDHLSGVREKKPCGDTNHFFFSFFFYILLLFFFFFFFFFFFKGVTS